MSREEVKHPKENSEGLKVLLIIYGVIIAVIEILIFILPFIAGQFGEMSLVWGVLFFLLLGALVAFGFFGLLFLIAGWRHPKSHTRGYTVICFFWECYCALWFVGGVMFGGKDVTLIWLFNVLVVLSVPPLMPIWYWDYKKQRREEKQKRKEPKAWELEDQLKELKELLSSNVITQEEYEQRKKKLLEKSA